MQGVVGEVAVQALEGDAELEARQMNPEATMRAKAEGQMSVRAPRELDLQGIWKDPLVQIGAGIESRAGSPLGRSVPWNSPSCATVLSGVTGVWSRSSSSIADSSFSESSIKETNSARLSGDPRASARSVPGCSRRCRGPT